MCPICLPTFGGIFLFVYFFGLGWLISFSLVKDHKLDHLTVVFLGTPYFHSSYTNVYSPICTERLLFFTSSPEFVIFCLLGNSHSDWGELQFQGRFILTLSNRVLLCSPDLTRVCYVQQAGLKLTALFLPLPSEYWNWRCHQTHVLSVVLTCTSLTAHNVGHFSYNSWMFVFVSKSFCLSQLPIFQEFKLLFSCC